MSRPLITVRTMRVDNTFPAAINASISARSACCSLPRRPDSAAGATAMTSPAPHCNPTSRPAESVLGRSAPLPSLADNECNPRREFLNRGLPLRPTCHCLTASNARPPRFWVSWAGKCSRTHDRRNEEAYDCAASAVNPCPCYDSAERRSPGGPFLGGAPRQLSRSLPRRIGLHRAAAGVELAQHRVIHPRTGKEPSRHHPALRRIRPQRPRPHMRGRALRALARTRLPHRLSGRCRCHGVGLTHTATVEVATDNNDLSPRPTQRVVAARTPGVRTEIPAPGVHRCDAHLHREHHARRLRRPRRRIGRVQRRGRPRTCAPGLPANFGDLRPGAAPQRPHRLRGATRVHRRVCPPACADTSGRRPTSPSPVVVHRCRSSSNTSTDNPARSNRRGSARRHTGWANPGLKSEACAQEFGQHIH